LSGVLTGQNPVQMQRAALTCSSTEGGERPSSMNGT